MNVNLDGKYAFKINPDFSINGFRNGQLIEIDNFGLAAAHQVCELINRVEELEKELFKTNESLAAMNDRFL